MSRSYRVPRAAFLVYNAGARTPCCLALLSSPSDATGNRPGRIRGAARSSVSWGRVSLPASLLSPSGRTLGFLLSKVEGDCAAGCQ